MFIEVLSIHQYISSAIKLVQQGIDKFILFLKLNLITVSFNISMNSREQYLQMGINICFSRIQYQVQYHPIHLHFNSA
jgi:hypothetical protein